MKNYLKYFLLSLSFLLILIFSGVFRAEAAGCPSGLSGVWTMGGPICASLSGCSDITRQDCHPELHYSYLLPGQPLPSSQLATPGRPNDCTTFIPGTEAPGNSLWPQCGWIYDGSWHWNGPGGVPSSPPPDITDPLHACDASTEGTIYVLGTGTQATRVAGPGDFNAAYTYGRDQACRRGTTNTGTPGAVGPNNGVCGSANGKTYPSTRTMYSPDELCVNSVVNQTAFPSPGGRVNWTCLGASGVNASCSASRLGTSGTVTHIDVPNHQIPITSDTSVNNNVSYCPSGLSRVWTTNGPICASITKLSTCDDNTKIDSTACHPELRAGLRACDASRGSATIYELTPGGANALPKDDLVSEINIFKLFNACAIEGRAVDAPAPPPTTTFGIQGLPVSNPMPPAESYLINNSLELSSFGEDSENSPTGSLDEASCEVIKGWAYDPDTAASQISIKIYDGASSSARLLATIPTNISLQDLNTDYGIVGSHGFSFDTPASVKDRNNHFIYAYGIDSADNTKKTLLSGSPTMINCGQALPAMSGTLTPLNPTCTVADGAGNCTQTFSWTTTNPQATSEVTSETGRPSPSIRANIGSQAFNVPYSPEGSTFYLYNNGREITRTTVSTICATGSTWTPSSGTCRATTLQMSGNLSPESTSCVIAPGARTCMVNASWTVSNPQTREGTVITSEINNTGEPSQNFRVASRDSGELQAFTIPFGNRNFYLYNSGTLLDLRSVEGVCATGTTWNGTTCMLNTARPPLLSGSGIGPYYWGGRIDGVSSENIIARARALAGALDVDTIRIALSPTSDISYKGGQCIPNFTLKNLASRSDWRAILADPKFKTIVITTYDGVVLNDCERENLYDDEFFTPENIEKIAQEYKELAQYLGTFNKTFILSNWEGDNQVYCDGAYDRNLDNCPRAAKALIAFKLWLQARTEGIHSAGASNVYSGVEFNIVHSLQDRGLPSVLYNVLPEIDADYFLYSSYESQELGPVGYGEDIDLIRAELSRQGKDPSRLLIGELGSTNSEQVRGLLPVIQEKNIPYTFIWALLDFPAGFGIYGNDGRMTDVGDVVFEVQN